MDLSVSGKKPLSGRFVSGYQESVRKIRIFYLTAVLICIILYLLI